MYCKHCGKNIDDDSKFCPECGGTFNDRSNTFSETYSPPRTESYNSYNKSWFFKRRNEMKEDEKAKSKKFAIIIISVISVIFLALIIWAVIPNSDGGDANKAGITYSNYQKIQIGMTYEKVVELLGSNGKVTADSYIDGLGRYQCYEWSRTYPSIAVVNIWFTDGKVDSKYQAGL